MRLSLYRVLIKKYSYWFEAIIMSDSIDYNRSHEGSKMVSSDPRRNVQPPQLQTIGEMEPFHIKTDQERHHGWVQKCQNEKKHLTRSIKKSIEFGYARNLDHAEKMLQDIQSHDFHTEDPRLHDHIHNMRGKASVPRSIQPPGILLSQKHETLQKLGHMFPHHGQRVNLSYSDKIASMSSNHINGITDRKFGYSKKKYFQKQETRGLQTRINLNFTQVPFHMDPKIYEDHHHYTIGTRPERKFLKGPEFPLHEQTIQELASQFKYVCDKKIQRDRHRNVSKESPFQGKPDIEKNIMLESVEFSRKRNPLQLNPSDNPVSKSLQVYAGTITDFGRQLLRLEQEGGSPGIMARKAKLITSIKLTQEQYEDQPVIDLKRKSIELQNFDNDVRAFQKSIPAVTNHLKEVLGKVAPASRDVNTKWARAQNIAQFASPSLTKNEEQSPILDGGRSVQKPYNIEMLKASRKERYQQVALNRTKNQSPQTASPFIGQSQRAKKASTEQVDSFLLPEANEQRPAVPY